MKQCPRCNRTYADDTLSYCLEDGTVLTSRYEPETTLVNPFPPSSNRPTVAYGRATPPLPASAPAPSRKPLLAVGALVVVALAVGLAIGGFIFQRSDPPSSDAASASPTPRSTTATAAKPAPASPTPTPAPIATPSPSIVQSTPKPESGCVLYNDKTDKAMVNVRMNCDTRDCDSDSSTLAGEYANNTPVRVITGASVRGVRFTWMKVIITGSGQTVWVASTKIKCG